MLARFGREIQNYYLALPVQLRDGLSFLGVIVLLIALLYYYLRLATKRSKQFAMVHFLVLIGLAELVNNFAISAIELTHIPLYGGLCGLLLTYFEEKSRISRVVLSVLIASLVSLADELVQGITPDRFFDTRDLALNFASTLIGIFMFLPLTTAGPKSQGFSRS